MGVVAGGRVGAGRSLLGVLLPLACPGCGRSRGPVCAACASTMGPPVPGADPPGLDAFGAAYAYEGVARELVARAKYRGARAAFGVLAAATAGAAPAAPPGATVTWPPTTAPRRRQRGFDPGELLARAVAARLGLAARPLLARVDARPRTGAPAADRRHGPVFAGRRRAAVPAVVLLVDDVTTTGGTLTAAATTLRANGARWVGAVTAARTPPPRTRSTDSAR